MHHVGPREDGATDPPSYRRLDLVADPGLAAEIAEELAPQLSHLLSRRLTPDRAWKVQVVCRRLEMEEQAGIGLAPPLLRQLARDEADLVISLTDQPRRAGRQLVVADVNRASRVAVVSIPGLGGLYLPKRVREMVVQLAGELAAPEDIPERDGPPVLRAIRRQAASSEDGDVDVRFVGVGIRALVRLLAGMVRANRPWRLIPQLSGAFAGALATGAYVVVSAFIWRLADAAGPLRLSAMTLSAVTAMVVWLVVKHRLWERPPERAARKLAAVYNAVTVISLTTGVLCMYVGVFILSLAGEGLLVRTGVLQETLGHPVDWTDYATIAWLASSMATLGGAIGAGLDDDDEARHAAYGYRQRERRADEDRRSEEAAPAT